MEAEEKPGIRKEVPSFADNSEILRKELDGYLILPGINRDDNVVTPDKFVGGEKAAHIKSGMDRLLDAVMGGMKNARVYVHIETDVSRFCADFTAIATVGDRLYSGQYMTSWLGIGMDDDGLIAQTALTIIKALAHDLGIRVFVDNAPWINKGAFVMKDIAK